MSAAIYPVPGSSGDINTSALGRLGDFFGQAFPDGAKIDDPFLADVRLALAQASMGFASMQAVAQGLFTSCDHGPQYAGGVASEGNRIYTPAEAMAGQLKSIRSLG